MSDGESRKRKSSEGRRKREQSRVIDQIVKVDDGYYSLLELSKPLCGSCGNPIGNIEEEYLEYCMSHTAEEAHRHFNLKRSCCMMNIDRRFEYPLTIDTNEKFDLLRKNNYEVTVIPFTFPQA